MKAIIILSLLLLTTSAFGELTKEDIRTIIKEENAALEKRVKEYIDLKVDALDQKLSARIDGVEKSLNAKIDALEKSVDDRFDGVDKSLDSRFGAVDKKLDWVWYMMIALIGLVTAAIAIPQIVIAYRDRGQQGMQAEIQQLRERLEALENTPS